MVQWELDPKESQRFDCYPEQHADEAKCKARGCIWEVRGDTDEVHMHIHILFMYSITKQQLQNVDMLSVPIQPSTSEGAPWCFYPRDFGYTVTEVKNTSSGITVDITRNKKYRSSGRPDSPDIDTIRVKIHYHSSDMLQFKVSVSSC